ncbi:ShlB/FhaC/HecB family hemolysin secretion/activation protein [Psittacicella hinzii]|uniref:Hemolysin activation/secretion protein n=1 Tax=Psittacicella hinzii TaxID=2028575 RepID=A0A3A1YLC9_9GAMM|nr:ShlB/FhaC/HecB family hemolysin secretion/activation protein [Psittacicella hinzii]RIY39093.1 hypothetical protein CKF58_02865 [Psittacicella hinzii]
MFKPNNLKLSFLATSLVAAVVSATAHADIESDVRNTIVNLNANYNSFQESRDYENFIQSRSKLLQRNASDNLRDVDVSAQPVDENSVKIDSFKFISEDDLSFSIINKLQAEADKFAGQQFNARKVAALKNNLNNILIRAGYVTSIVYITNEGFKDNTLTFNIKWGKVNQVRVSETQEDRDSFKNRAMLTTIPGFYKDVLRINTIDQIVDNLTTTNKDVRIDVAATLNKTGYSDIIVNTQRSAMPRFTIGLNNANSQDVTTLQFVMNYADLIGINDSWTLSYNKRLYRDWSDRHTDIVSLRYDQPLGNFNLSVNNQWTSYKNTVTTQAVTGDDLVYIAHAPQFKSDWKLSYVAFRDKTQIANVFVGLAYKRAVTDIRFKEGNANILYTKRYAVDWRIGANYLNNALFGGRLFVEGYYTQGFGAFNGDYSAAPELQQYSKYAKFLSLYLNYNKNFFIGEQLFNTNTTVQGQYSLVKRLSGDYVTTFGDAYSVRGLRQDTISGDDGFLISTNFGPQFSIDNAFIRYVNPYLGLDYGLTRNKAYDDEKAESYRAASVSIGVATGGNHWRASLNVAKPFAYKLVDDAKPAKNFQVYFNVSTSF